jgi:hypothetical protein
MKPLSRRTFLRGVDVSMAIPWLESRNVWGWNARQAAGGGQGPVRLAVFFAGNGFHGKEWWAKGEGASMELGKVLAPIHDFRQPCRWFRGFTTSKPPTETSTVRKRETCSRAHRLPRAARSDRAPALINS